jgi:hypothetical protein
MFKSGFIIVLAFVSVFSFSVHAKPVCAAAAQGSAEYKSAVDLVRLLPEFKRWMASHTFPVVFGEPFDKEVLVHDKCFWSVSVYANRPDRLEPWMDFLVYFRDREIFVPSEDGDDYVTISRWRKMGKSGLR